MACDKCWSMMDMLQEEAAERRVIMPVSPVNGALYIAEVVNVSRDWETGYVDDWDIEFVEYKEEKVTKVKEKFSINAPRGSGLL